MYQQADAKSYALALFSLFEEEKLIKKTYDFMTEFSDFLEQDDKLIFYLNSYKTDEKQKFKLIDKMFKDKIDLKTFSNFLKVLTRKQSANLLKPTLKIYLKHADDFLGIIQGKLITAFDITKATINKITKKLEKEFNKKVILKNYIDKDLISGFRIEINNKIIEQNLQSDLNKIMQMIMKKEI